MSRRYLALFAWPLLSLAGCNAEKPLQCPTHQLSASTGDLHETEQDIEAYQARFAAGFSGNSVGEAVASLRTKYPGAADDAIGNYLVAAYCPVVVRSVDGAPDQKARLAAFENAVHAALGD